MRQVFRSLRRDRQGAVAIMVAGIATSMMGAAALATDAGLWYLAQRKAQTAADMAAFAAVKSLADSGSGTTAEAVGRDVLARNGFTGNATTAVAVRADSAAVPPVVRVTVEQVQPLLLARAIRQEAPVVRANARAITADMSDGACVLTLTGSIQIGNNIRAAAENCALASNHKAADAFQTGSGQSIANGSFTVAASTIVTSGGCRGCTEAQAAGKLQLTYPPSTYQPPVRNPYEALGSFRPPSFTRACTMAQAGDTLQPYETTRGCYSSIALSGSKTTTLLPGTYYLRGGDLSIASGNLVCPTCTEGRGVTIVLTGDRTNAIGKVKINTNGRVALTAPRSNPAVTNGSNVDLGGVLIFRDSNPALVPSGTEKQVSINGGPEIAFNGAVVAPNAAATLSGNSTTGFDPCTVLVVGSLSLEGGATLTARGCAARGTAVPKPQVIRLTEW